MSKNMRKPLPASLNGTYTTQAPRLTHMAPYYCTTGFNIRHQDEHSNKIACENWDELSLCELL